MARPKRIRMCEQADGKSRRAGGGHQWLKRCANRLQRRQAKSDPDCVPTHNRHKGYET